MPKFNLDEVIGLGLQENVPVPEIAQAVNAWHKETLTEARYFVKDQEDFWKGTAAVDRQVSETLEGLKSMAQLEIAQQAFPNPVQFQQFNDVLASSGYDPDKMDAPQEWIDTAKRMDAIATSPAFNTPRHQYGKIGFGPNKLADYSLREKEDGSGYEAVVFPTGDSGERRGDPLRVDLPPRAVLADAATKRAQLIGQNYDEVANGLRYGDTTMSPDFERQMEDAMTERDIMNQGPESAALHIALSQALKGNQQFISTIPQNNVQQFTTRPLLSLMRSLAQAGSAATGTGADILGEEGQNAVDLTTPGRLRARYETAGPTVGDAISQGIESLAVFAIPGGVVKAGGAALRTSSAAGEGMAVLQGARGANFAGSAGYGTLGASAYGANYAQALAEADAAQASGDATKADRIRRFAQLTSLLNAGIEMATERIFPDEANLVSGKRITVRQIATMPLKEGIEGGVGAVGQNVVNLIDGKQDQNVLEAAWGEAVGSIPFMGRMTLKKILQKQPQTRSAAGPASAVRPDQSTTNTPTDPGSSPGTAPAAPANTAFSAGTGTDILPTGPGTVDGSLLAPPGVEMDPRPSTSSPSTPAPAPAAPANTAFSAGTGTDILPTGPGTVDGSLLAPPGVEMADPRPSTSSPSTLPEGPDATLFPTPDQEPMAVDPSTLDPSTPRLSTSRPTETDPLGTIPETPATLDEQFRRVKSGTKPGMIFPGQTAKEVNAAYQPGQEDDFVLTDTPAGAVLHPVDIPRTEVRAAVAEDRLGHLLGYGIPRKPVPTPDSAPPIAVTLRTAEGTEVDSVLTTPELAPAVTEKLQARAEPGDTVQMETPQDVARQRIAPLTNPTPQDTVSLRADLVVDTPNAGATGTPPTPTSLQTRLPALPGAKGAAPAKRKFTWKDPSALAFSEQPLVQFIRAQGGMASKATALQNVKRSETQTVTDGFYGDIHPGMGNVHYARQIYSREGQDPDKIATAAFYEGLIPDGLPSTLASALNQIYDAANRNAEAAKKGQATTMEEAQIMAATGMTMKEFEADQKVKKRQGDAFQKATQPKTKAGETRKRLPVDQLTVGSTVKLGTETFRVKNLVYDQDGYLQEVEMQDGDKFGTQYVSPGEVHFVENVRIKKQSAAPTATDDSMPFSQFRRPRTHAPNATAAAAASLQKSMPQLAGGESVEFSPSVDAHLATPDGAARGYTPEQVAGMRTSEGFHDPATGRTVLFLDQLEARPGESARAAVARVLFHERIGHQGVNYLLKTDATFAAKWNALASQIPAADLAELRAQGYGHLTSGEVALEWLARQVDATARTQGGFKVDGLRGLARQLWDALRAVVNKIMAQFGSTTAQRDVQLRELISRARRADVVRMGTGPIQFSKLPTPESNPTPSTVSPTPDYNINRFGLRVQADDRLRAAWRATFPPATYKTFTEEALRAQVREWMADNGGLEGATALFMDASSGLQDYERNALGQQLALSLDLRARRQENAKNAAGVAQTEAILDQVIATLETLATQAGQALRAFGMWSRFSPRGIVRAVQRETARKRDEHFQKTLGVDPAAALAAVNSDDPKEQEKLIKSLAPKTRAARDATPRFIRTLLEARRNGALSRADFLDAYSAAFNLPRFTPEFSSRIRELAARVESTPSGSWLRNRAQSDLMTAIANWEGLKTGDIWTAFWYANILSGLGTQLVNISGNAAHLLLKTSTVMLSNNPRHMMQFFKGLVSGATAGAKQAKEAFINGEPVMRGDEQWQKRDVLEMLWSDKPATWGKLLGKYGVASWGRYVFRALTAMDAMFYNTAKEARAFLEISRNLQPGQTMQTALGMDAATLTAAQAQAVADLKSAGVAATPNNIDRRTLEILESKRAPDVLATARKFGGAATYNYDPAGTMGAFAEGINAIIRGVPIVRAVIPFTRIVANITDQSLDWTGYGLIRAGLGRHTFNAKGERFTTRERVEKALAGAIGLAGMSALYALASSHADKDDDTVPFMIYGGGPLDKNKREQLPKGWKAYSVKVGDNYISYAETPLTLILGALGTALDKRRYSPTKPGDDDTLKRAELLLAGAGKSLSRAGILSGLNNLFGIIDGTANPKTFVARTASGFTPAQGLLRDVAKAMDPEAVDTSTIEGVFLQNLPVLRTQAGKKLNVFGEPVKEPGPWLISRLVTKPDRSDADAVWLTRNKLHIPDLDAEIVVGKYLTKDDLTRLQNGYAPTEAQRQALIAQRDAGYLTPQQRETLLRTTGPKLREAIKFLQNVQAATPNVSTKQLQTQLNAKVEAARQQAMRAVIGL